MVYKDPKQRDLTQGKWDKANATRFNVKLMNSTDADIIAYLKTVSSKQGAIKAALRYYIAHGCPDVDTHDHSEDE